MPLPYVEARAIHVGPLELHPFGMLVATGVLIGSFLGVRRAVQRGLSRVKMESFASYILVSAFVLSHMLDVLMYRPAEALRNPLELLMVWKGISSYGGFIGALVGAFIWSYVKKEPIMPYSDMCATVFPIGWMFGRAGCSVAHDHVGRLSSSALAVAFPDGLYYPPGPRLDLGFLELLLTIPIAAFTWWFARKPRHAGAITGLICLVYAPIRFPLDAMRAVDIASPDARYAGLTPAQWLSFGLFAVGVWLLYRSRTQPVIGADVVPAAPEEPAARAA